MAKKQIIVIHGGETFDTYEEYIDFLKNFEFDFERLKKKGWKDSIQEDLGDEFEIIKPQMPSQWNAKYLEWKIWFEKLIPFFADEVVLVGHSLGGIFLAKYLSENDFPKKIKGTFLVAPPFDDQESEYSMADFVLPESLEKLEKQGGKIFLYHSKDDDVVSFDDFEKYKNALPNAQTRIFEDRGHFSQEEFSEIVSDIKSLF